MFENALEKLKKTMTGLGSQSEPNQVRKSDLGTMEGGDEGSVDIGDLASQAVVLFETGELSPDVDSLSDWAREQGLPDSDVDEFASAVIDSYFDDSSEGEGDDPLDEPDGGMDDMAMDEVNKSILALKEGQTLIAEGLNKVLEKDAEIKSLKEEIGVLKSMLKDLGEKPANQKTPIIESNQNSSQNIQKGFAPANAAQAKEFEVLILKGIKSGELTLEEMSFFEATGRLSESAASYVNSQKVLEGNK